MHEAATVRVLESPGGLHADQQRLGRCQSPPEVEHASQGPATEILRDEVRDIALAPVVDRHDVWVVQRGSRASFGVESLEERSIVCEGVVQDLDRDASTQRHVVGEVHRGGRSRADWRDQPVAPPEYLTDTVDQAGNCHGDKLVVTPVGFANAVASPPSGAQRCPVATDRDVQPGIVGNQPRIPRAHTHFAPARRILGP